MIIAIITPKGGEGKTTTALMLTVLLSEIAHILGIDMDIQNSFTFSMGLEFSNEKVKKENIVNYILTESIEPIEVDKNISIIPSSLNLSSMRTMVQGKIKQVFNDTNIRESYKHIIIDTHPSYDNFMIAAGYAADLVIYPIQLRSVWSQKCLFDTIQMLSQECPSILTKLKVLPTFYENTKDEIEIENYITNEVGDVLFQTRIPLTSRALKIGADYKTYIKSSMKSFTDAYRNLIQEIGE